MNNTSEFKEAQIIEAVVKDGNRIMNIELRDDYTVREVLLYNNFKWIKDSINVNGERMPDNTLDIPMNQFIHDQKRRPGSLPRVTITMTAPKPEPKKKADAGKENEK